MTAPEFTRRRKAPHRHRRVADALRNAGAAPVTAGPAPDLSMREPEGAQRTVVSGSIAALLHAAAVAALIGFAAAAPEVVEELTREVKILKELPGSNNPAPRQVSARRVSTPRAAARQVARAEPVKAVPVEAKALTLDQLEAAKAPKQLDRRAAESKRVEAKNTARVEAQSVDLSQIKPIDVSTDLKAPKVDIQVPKAIVQGEAIEMSAPQVFESFVEASSAEYSDQALDGETLAAGTAGVDSRFAETGIEFDGYTDYGDGQVGGVAGGEPGTVACMDSAFVGRYLDRVEDRTYRRWVIPPGTAPGIRVVLRFELDASGSVTRVSADGSTNETLATSAVQALRSASPFPAMDDAVRCLDGKRLKSTFITRTPGS